MNAKKIALVISVLTIGYFTANGQDTKNIITRLANADSSYSSRVTVKEHGNVSQIISGNSTPDAAEVSGYRIRIFFDNSQTGRESAFGALEKFRSQFPDIPAGYDYQAPYHRVTAGYCLNEDEALMLLERVVPFFNKAFMISDKIPLGAFANAGGIILHE